MEVLLMENKHREYLTELMEENQANLSVLVDAILVKKEEDKQLKKLSVRWNMKESIKP